MIHFQEGYPITIQMAKLFGIYIQNFKLKFQVNDASCYFFNPSNGLLNNVIYPAIPLFSRYYLLYYLYLSRQSFDKKKYFVQCLKMKPCTGTVSISDLLMNQVLQIDFSFKHCLPDAPAVDMFNG
jgi:hypothetical protein